MIPRHLKPRKRRPSRTERCAAALGAVLLAGACATPPGPPPTAAAAPEPIRAAIPVEPGPVIARDADFAIVRVGEGEDLAALARRYLGNGAEAWRIAEFNGVERVQRGQTVVVPLRHPNAIGVHASGFQTVPILCYHRFGSKTAKLTVSKAAFEAQMDYLARHGYHVVSLARIRAFLDGKEALPAKTVAITIDDGYRSTYEIAYPVLKKHGFPATVFLYSDFVGASDALTWPQMKEMLGSGLVEIQPHSKTHANLSQRQQDESEAHYRERVRREVETPVGVLRDRLELASTVFAYPYGDVNDVVVEELARAKLGTGVTVTPGGNAFFAYPYMLRRTMVFGDQDLDAFKGKLSTFARMPGR